MRRRSSRNSSLHGEVTALLPPLLPGAIPRSSRGGPDRTRRACSAAAASVARGGPPPAAACWDVGPHLRGWSLLSPLLAADQRASARVAGERERADRAGLEPRWARRIALAPRREQRTQTRTGTPAAAARRYLTHGPPRRPRRAAAPSPRLRQRWRRAPSSAQPPKPLGAIPADVQSPARQLARQLRGPPCESFARCALRRAGTRRSPCSRMPAQRLRRARAGRRVRLAAAHVVDARAPRQQQQQRTCSARRLWATRASVRAENAREMGRVVRWGGRGRGLCRVFGRVLWRRATSERGGLGVVGVRVIGVGGRPASIRD